MIEFFVKIVNGILPPIIFSSKLQLNELAEFTLFQKISFIHVL